MLLAQYNLSWLMDRIASAGYVERRLCEDDGRGQLITITDQGKAIRRKMWPVYARGIEAAMGRHLSHNQAEVLDEILGALTERQRQDNNR
jgi:DNA-binding MarR family transcriptional regulator